MTSTLRTPTEAPARPAALHASTLCEAFQITAPERADQVALRTIVLRRRFTSQPVRMNRVASHSSNSG